MREEALDLVCELSDEDVRDRALEMSGVMLRMDELDVEKKNAMKSYSSEISALAGRLSRLSANIRSRRETRTINCIIEFHTPNVGFKRITRKDTGEWVKDVQMSNSEVQENLFDEHREQVQAEMQGEQPEPVCEHCGWSEGHDPACPALNQAEPSQPELLADAEPLGGVDQGRPAAGGYETEV